MPEPLPPYIQCACPKCGGHTLNVVVMTSAQLVQSEDNFETEDTGSHEWDGKSPMWCGECKHRGSASDFDTAKQGEEA